MRLFATIIRIGTFVLFAATVYAQETITVAWDPNPEPDVIGYTLFSGPAPGAYTAAQNVGNTTRRTMTLPPGTYYFVVRAYNISGQVSLVSPEVSATIATLPPPPLVPTWQAVWQNRATGHLTSWNMAGVTMVNSSELGGGILDPAWQVRALADMNGDGQKDFILQHLKQGYLAVWLMSGNQLVESRMMNQLADPAWLLVAAADFNADGKNDLVFEHTVSGTLGAWLMNGTQELSGIAITPGAVTDVNWRVIAAADMNGDSKPDLIWQHLKTGRITTWLMNGTVMQDARSFSMDGPTDPDWQVRGVADVNNNGSPDILWQHDTTGYMAVWILNGLTVVESTLWSPSQVGPGWSLAGGR
jgi:hypothetical protein